MVGEMADPDAQVLHDLSELDRPHSEDAFFRLLHLERESLPILAGAFRRASRPELRAKIIEVVWQLRWLEAIPLLVEAVRDPADSVWKEGLNGLVAIGGDAGFKALQDLQREHALPSPSGATKLEWIEEALQQIPGSRPTGR
jgi:hypothetical protein